MQLLFLAALAPDAQRLLDDLSHKIVHKWTGEILTFAGITLALWIVAAWIGSLAILKDNTGLGNAIATGFRWFFTFLASAALAGAAFYFARLRGSATMTSASIGIGAILIAYAAVAAPMQVYKINVFKALGIALIGILVHLAAQVAVQKAMNDPLLLQSRFDQVRRLAALPPDDASAVLSALKKADAPVLAAVVTPTPAPIVPQKNTASPASAPPPKPRGKTIAERQDELKKVYAEVVAKHDALREGDEQALADYTRASDDYAKKLAQLQKDADAEKK